MAQKKSSRRRNRRTGPRFVDLSKVLSRKPVPYNRRIAEAEMGLGTERLRPTHTSSTYVWEGEGLQTRARFVDDAEATKIKEDVWEEVIRLTCRNPHQLARARMVRELFPFESPGIMGSFGPDTIREQFEDEGAREACYDFIRHGKMKKDEVLATQKKGTAKEYACARGYEYTKKKIEKLQRARKRKKK